MILTTTIDLLLRRGACSEAACDRSLGLGDKGGEEAMIIRFLLFMAIAMNGCGPQTDAAYNAQQAAMKALRGSWWCRHC